MTGSRRSILAFAMLALAVVATAHAQEIKNQSRDCYAESGFAPPAAPADAALFVFIDETTALDDNLKQEAIDRATDFLRPNRNFAVGRFSAFVQGHYADIVASGMVQPDLSADQRDSLPRPTVRQFDDCRAFQLRQARRGIGTAMLGLMNGASTAIIRSDIVTSLQMFSATVNAAPAARKIVLVVSDMLENSALASFYQHGSMAAVPRGAIASVAKAGAIGDFGGAAVYVLGAGVAPPQQSGSYQDPIKLAKLKQFWSAWFDRSNARLVVFGEPSVTVGIE